MSATIQSTGSSEGMGAALVLLPFSGFPISFHQIEERSRMHHSAPDVVRGSKVFRDGSGRVRIEDSMYVLVLDPVAGSRILLLSGENVAYRTPLPQSKDGSLAFIGMLNEENGEPSPEPNWTAAHEHVGKRMIEGIEFDCTRIVQAAEGAPQLTKTLEQWYSDSLKLIGFAQASTPYKIYTIRIRNLSRDEPSANLFTIPSEYNIVDVSLPH